MRSPCCLRVYMCNPPSLLGNGSVSTFRGNEYTRNNRIIVGHVFYAARVVSKGSLLVCYVYLPTVAGQLLGKHVPAATNTQQQKNCWTRRFLCGPCRIKGK
jgi:hypothetical protein